MTIKELNGYLEQMKTVKTGEVARELMELCIQGVFDVAGINEVMDVISMAAEIDSITNELEERATSGTGLDWYQRFEDALDVFNRNKDLE